MSADTYWIYQNNNYAINSFTNTGGSNIQFIDIGTDASFNSVTGNNGRIGRRYAWPAASSGYTGNWKVNQYLTDISINYLDLSWNFYIAVDNSRNYMLGQAPGISNGDGTFRDPIIHIYDISYNGRGYLGDVDASGNPYVPKIYDASGGQSNAFSNISFLLTYKDNDNGGFTYSPQMYDPAEVLPTSGGGGGTDPSGGTGGGGGGGGGQVDPSGGTDSSGNNVADNSQNIFIIDNSLNEWFFDAPRAASSGTITLDTAQNPPRLISSWINPTQKRAAFDFVGNIQPMVDNSKNCVNSSSSGFNDITDDYNYLPYFQGLRVQILLYDQTGSILGTGQGWTDVTLNSNTSYLPNTISKTIWETVDFLPRQTTTINIFNSTVSGNEYNFNNGTYGFSLPATWGTGNTPTAGAKVRLRIAMVNRAQVTIEDPSYVEHNAALDMSWNWIYLPDTGGLAIGDYGDPTPPLTITIPTLAADLKYNRFFIRGYNDNSGNDIQLSVANRSESIVEKELGTRFSSLNKNNASLPKVQYRYDLSGSRASSSKQVNGSQAGVSNLNYIDISINIPDVADNSLNWIPSNANNVSTPWDSGWTSTLTSSTHPLIIFPEHNYKLTGYSMRYSLDPSRNTVDGYTDASKNSAWNGQPIWTTLRPLRSECTNIYASGLPNTEITGNYSLISGTWPAPISQYTILRSAYKAWEDVATIASVPSLIFLNSNTTLQYTSTAGYGKSIRANGIVSSTGNETYVGIETVNNDIIRMNSEIKLDGVGNWVAGWDLSGVQRGFGSPGIGTGATNPTNVLLEWKTSAITNAYETTNDISRNGGYYCGTILSDVKIKNINLANYRDVSNNTNQKGYKVTIYQELKPSATGNWSRYTNNSVSATGGQYKLFNPATIPTQDITFDFGGATFVINDGYDGTNSYEGGGRTNNFKFGSNTSGQDPSSNFFGLPKFKTSQDVISYSMTFNQFDPTWWPADSSNMLDLLRFYVRSGTAGSALPSVGYSGSTYNPGYHSTKPSGNYIQWGGTTKTVTKPWSAASNATNAFPDLPSSLNGGNDLSTLNGTFDFDDSAAASFGSNKYSRDLFDHNTYSLLTPNTSNPLFYVNASYDNNIFRSNRGKTNEEYGERKTIGEEYSSAGNSSYKNRFEGKGVGPDGKYLLFWDNTFNTGVTLHKVGERTGSGTYSQYPFVDNGIAPDYTTTYDHTLRLSDGTQSLNGGERQLMWAKNGFKPGQWATASENPYIDYERYYWFGNHVTNPFTQDYLYLNNRGEQLGSTATTYAPTANDPKWWEINYGNNNDFSTASPPTWNWNSNLLWKFMVLKVTIPTLTLPASGYCGFKLSYMSSSGSLITLPTITKSQLTGGAGSCNDPVVWWQEKGGLNSHPGTNFATPKETGWKATHLTGNWSLGSSANCNNNSGSMDITIATRATNTDKVHRLWGFMGTADGNYDLYFRIGLPNQGSIDIKQITIQFVEVDSNDVVTDSGSSTPHLQNFSYIIP